MVYFVPGFWAMGHIRHRDWFSPSKSQLCAVYIVQSVQCTHTIHILAWGLFTYPVFASLTHLYCMVEVNKSLMFQHSLDSRLESVLTLMVGKVSSFLQLIPRQIQLPHCIGSSWFQWVLKASLSTVKDPTQRGELLCNSMEYTVASSQDILIGLFRTFLFVMKLACADFQENGWPLQASKTVSQFWGRSDKLRIPNTFEERSNPQFQPDIFIGYFL